MVMPPGKTAGSKTLAFIDVMLAYYNELQNLKMIIFRNDRKINVLDDLLNSLPDSHNSK
jgi:hypothetical protein